MTEAPSCPREAAATVNAFLHTFLRGCAGVLDHTSRLRQFGEVVWHTERPVTRFRGGAEGFPRVVIPSTTTTTTAATTTTLWYFPQYQPQPQQQDNDSNTQAFCPNHNQRNFIVLGPSKRPSLQPESMVSATHQRTSIAPVRPQASQTAVKRVPLFDWTLIPVVANTQVVITAQSERDNATKASRRSDVRKHPSRHRHQ